MSDQKPYPLHRLAVVEALKSRIKQLESDLHDSQAIGDFPAELRDRHQLNEHNRYLEKQVAQLEALRDELIKVLEAAEALDFSVYGCVGNKGKLDQAIARYHKVAALSEPEEKCCCHRPHRTWHTSPQAV